MASTHSVSVVSEAAFGCEHIAAVLTCNETTAGQFKDSFMNTQKLLTPKPGIVEAFANEENLGPQQRAGPLKPKYTCLTCSETCTNSDRKAHAERTGHQFFMDSRHRSLYCQNCDDFVYDHGLDRLRSPTAVFASKGLNKRPANEAAIDEVYVRNNANKRPCAKQGARGLPNCIGCAVAEAFSEFNNTEKVEGFTALNVLLASWLASSNLAGYQQQDAHEFYQFLVDKLHACTEGHVDDHDSSCSCFFHKAFYGKLRSTVTCEQCGNVTRTEEPMVDLSLDVQAKKRAMGGQGLSSASTLSGCLESYTSPEKLTAGVYNCSGCDGTRQKATKQLRIKKLPAILCMQLKVEGRIDFPLSINMLPYTTNPHSKKVDRSRYVYDLSSAVVHSGKLDSGHYYAYCRQGDQWMLFNDDQVTAVSEADVLNADAYLLFYSLRYLPGIDKR